MRASDVGARACAEVICGPGPGWTYGLDGQLQAAQRMGGGLVSSPCPTAWCLMPGAWCGDRSRRSVLVQPHLVLIRSGDACDVNRVVPVGPGAGELIIDGVFAPVAGEQAVATRLDQSEQVRQQDLGVCEPVPRGLASPAHDRGVHAPAWNGRPRPSTDCAPRSSAPGWQRRPAAPMMPTRRRARA